MMKEVVCSNISKENIADDISAYDQMIRSQCIQSHVYEFNYDGVRMNLSYEDIYYLEKNEKMVYFYTKKGVFHKRDSMNALEEVFKEFGFLRVHVSYIVNSKYIVAWYKDEVELINKVLIPVSRGKKTKDIDEITGFTRKKGEFYHLPFLFDFVGYNESVKRSKSRENFS